MSTMSQPTEQAVRFSYGDDPVYGILHRPQPGTPLQNTGLILVNSAIRTRCGPHRLYVHLARGLSAVGYHVLRYDPPGIGESPGSIVDAPDYKRRFVDSLEGSEQTVSFFQSETGVEHVGIMGLCAGAYCAMISAAADPRVEFAILASLPVQELGDMSEEALTGLAVGNYFSKLLQPASWLKLLKGQSDFEWVARSLRSLLTKGYSPPGLDPALWESSRRLTESGRRILYFYGEKDWLYRAFTKNYAPRLKRLNGAQHAHQMHVVEGADHIFSQRDWQNELIAKSVSWLDELGRER